MPTIAAKRIVFSVTLVSIAAAFPLRDAVCAEKLVDRILFKHDPSPNGVYRWSEASTVNLDGKKHLMMLVTAFGHGGHDHTAADILEFHSNDGGLTWTPLDKAKVFQRNIGKANVMSPSLLRLDDREILCFFMVKNKALVDSGTWMKRSSDNGKTWSKPRPLPYKGYGGLSSDRAVLTSKGRIILPSWVSTDRLASTRVYCHYSDDRGTTWKQTGLVSTPKGSTGRGTDPAAEEPTIIELNDGRLMMFIRVYLKSIYVSSSDDGGTTWSPPRSSGIPSPGSMPTVRRMPDGNMLLIWNWAPVEKINGPFPRTFLTAAVSTDDGRNFASVRHLDGAADFPGKITMANVNFVGPNAVITYSKSMSMKNAYNWRLQVVPIGWFYEGDRTQVYGEKYLPTLEAKLSAPNRPKPQTRSVLPPTIPRPSAKQRREAMTALETQVEKNRAERDLVAAFDFEEALGTFAFDSSPGAGRIDQLRIWKSVRYTPAEKPRFSTPAKKPRKVGTTRQLFLDDELIAENDGLQRIVNQPARHHLNPVLTYDKPWERNCVITWGSVLFDREEQVFKIWYESYDKFPPKNERSTLLCYATSKDGVHWEKPELGLFTFRGSKANNIVFLGDGEELDAATVFFEPRPTPEAKYRMYWYDFARRGVRCATSADGLRWKPLPGVVVKSGDRATAGYDAARNKYFVITRIRGRRLRTCGLWESANGTDFDYVGEILAPDERDPPRTSFYGMVSFPYAGVRLGFLEFFYDRPIRKLNTQLVYSRDGSHWKRACSRQVFLNWGPPGSWDQAWAFPSQNPPVRVGDKLYVFYQGRSTLHYGEQPWGHIGSIGLAFLRVDGFASLDSIWKEGSVTTEPLLLEGKTLHVNAVARPGTVSVEVLDLSGLPLPGFSRDKCRPISNVDSLDAVVVWENGRDLTRFKNKPVRLRFFVHGAKLYSFWVE